MITKLAYEDQKSWDFHQAERGCHGMTGWYGTKDQQNKTNKFLSVPATLYVMGNSQNDEGKLLKQHVLKNFVPWGFNTKIAEIQEEHQQAITEWDNKI